ncbi:MAG: hypothetical protein H6737_13625 [Alphaproteobacteria bacterium]|nr:hypothetical protein [Alphaproteobacteria bacterium]
MNLALLLLASGATASTGEGLKLVVQVVDDADHPVSTATVRIDDEGLRHRVNHRTGRWKGHGVYPQNQEPAAFETGQVVTLTAAAPGHLPRTVKYRVRHARNVVKIPLQALGTPTQAADQPEIDVATLLAVSRANCDSPDQAPALFAPAVHRPIQLDPETIGRLGDLEDADPHLTAGFSELLLAQGPGQFDAALQWADIARAEAHTVEGGDYVGLVNDLYRVRAIAYHVRWQQWELTWLDEPSRKNKEQVDHYRELAANIASSWVAWADAAGASTELPTALCMAASDRPLECSP